MLANNCTAVKLIQAKIVQKAGWAQGPVWTGTENLAPIGVNPRPLQPTASRYTDWALLAHDLGKASAGLDC